MTRVMTLLVLLPAVLIAAIGANDWMVGGRARAAALTPGSMARWEAQAEHIGRGELRMPPARVAANMRAANDAIKANNEFGVAGADALRETGLWTSILAGVQLCVLAVLWLAWRRAGGMLRSA